MTAVSAPVELPAGRRSYYSPTPVQDIHDPNWIPVLDGADLKISAPFMEKEVSPYSTASFSPFPTRPTSPKQKPPLVHNYSRSSLAPESLSSELETGQSPPISSDAGNKSEKTTTPDPETQHLRRTSGTPSSNDGQETVTSESMGASTAASTIGTASTIEEQYYILPGQQPESKDDIQPPAIAASSRCSTVSSRKIAAPTSKYNRKPVTSMAPMRPPTIKSQPQTPHDSPRLGPVAPTPNFSTPHVQALSSPQIPAAEAQQSGTRPTTPKLQTTKSTASDRRQRALSSHPSNVSLQGRSRANSSSDDADALPRPPSIRHRSRKSTDSRSATSRSIVFDSQNPTPAPTTPLPQLPPEARRPSTRDGSTASKPMPPPPEAHLAAASSVVKQSDHSDLASFMTQSNRVVFRRFDDVHVRLLLCLQDEIAELERELLKLEGGDTTAGDKTVQRTKILRELRRVVAEYDHLFANWSQMQAHKAGAGTMRDLKQWLEKPSTSAGAGLAGSAKTDLEWLENSKDLSSVALGGSSASPVPRSVKGGAGEGARSGGGFAALFGCAGKRK